MSTTTVRHHARHSSRWVSRSAADTRRLGGWLARQLREGDVVALLANLGSGKTTLVQGMASALGAEAALSPTFVIAQTLPGRKTLHHLDFYRLSKREILAMGVQDYLLGQGGVGPGIVLLEWAERCPELWPPERLEVRLRVASRGHARHVTLTGYGERLAKLAASFPPSAWARRAA